MYALVPMQSNEILIRTRRKTARKRDQFGRSLQPRKARLAPAPFCKDEVGEHLQQPTNWPPAGHSYTFMTKLS